MVTRLSILKKSTDPVSKYWDNRFETANLSTKIAEFFYMEKLTTEQLESMREQKEVNLVDVLSEEHFENEHIEGAINIPLDEIGSKALEKFDKDEEIVVYCKDTECSASPKAAKKLEKLGFQNIKDYEVGLKGWKEAGNTTV
ncbi:MAG: rhodanese-like domain-containing protein [Nanohaloarchaea archaeon]|nr:rhodanese-like domain-containing protein [Candidatus Nanohaloarchaea archaeon]